MSDGTVVDLIQTDGHDPTAKAEINTTMKV